jgi:hypothetical protein
MSDLEIMRQHLAKAKQLSKEQKADMLTYLIECAIMELNDIKSGARSGVAAPQPEN